MQRAKRAAPDDDGHGGQRSRDAGPSPPRPAASDGPGDAVDDASVLEVGPVPVSDADGADEVGPMPVRRAPGAAPSMHVRQLLLDVLPDGAQYERSYMHRDTVSHVVVIRPTDFIVTASVDGHVKFWKKQDEGIEFVKHFRAHLGAVAGLAASADGLLLCSAGDDRALKVFDVINFDMINMMRLSFEPGVCEWLHAPHAPQARVAVADRASARIVVMDAHGSGAALAEVSCHRRPVVAIALNGVAGVAISADEGGVLQYWDAETYAFPEDDRIAFRFITDTDLFALARLKARPCSIALSPDGAYFVVTASDRHVRVFQFATGKLSRVLDETLEVRDSAKASGRSGVGPTGASPWRRYAHRLIRGTVCCPGLPLPSPPPPISFRRIQS